MRWFLLRGSRQVKDANVSFVGASAPIVHRHDLYFCRGALLRPAGALDEEDERAHLDPLRVRPASLQPSRSFWNLKKNQVRLGLPVPESTE
jgi:hypothetical protein